MGTNHNGCLCFRVVGLSARKGCRESVIVTQGMSGKCQVDQLKESSLYEPKSNFFFHEGRPALSCVVSPSVF